MCTYYDKEVERRLSALEARVPPSGTFAKEASKYPRDGERWTDFEKEVLATKLETLLEQLAGKYGRKPGAIAYAVLRTIAISGRYLHAGEGESIHAERRW